MTALAVANYMSENVFAACKFSVPGTDSNRVVASTDG